MDVHNISKISPKGVFINYHKEKEMTDDMLNNHQHIGEHYDDYYVFMWMHEGNITMKINFEDVIIRSHSLIFLEPGTIHQFISMQYFKEGCFLGVDKSVLNESIITKLNKLTFGKTYLPIGEEQERELQLLLPIVIKRLDTEYCHDFAKVVIDIYLQSLTQNSILEAKGRHIDIFLGFRSLLKENLRNQHLPSFYAEKLCISTGYLNEAVMKSVHMSTQQYITQEAVAQAKRMLYCTNDTIQQIAWKLGYSDAAYFTRLFTKSTACTPTNFRRQVRSC